MNIAMKFNRDKSDLEIEVCENGNIVVSIIDKFGESSFTINEDEAKTFIKELNNINAIKEMVDES